LYELNARLVTRQGRDDALVVALGRFLRTIDEATVEINECWERRQLFDYDDTQLGERATA
jgi:hypothetical protein